MSRLIDADLAIQKCKEPSIYDLTDFEEFINSLPTVDAEPVRHGKWIFDYGNPICSLCGEEPYRKSNRDMPKYCPNCGVKMTGGIENG